MQRGTDAARRRRPTADGLEQRWGANFVGHFWLAHLLLGALDAGGPSRLVFLSSLEEQGGAIPWDDPLGLHAPPRADWYASSKLANLMVGLEMGRRLRGTNVDVFAVHPGIAQTDIFHRFERHPGGVAVPPGHGRGGGAVGLPRGAAGGVCRC